jgi:hypothetical protein
MIVSAASLSSISFHDFFQARRLSSALGQGSSRYNNHVCYVRAMAAGAFMRQRMPVACFELIAGPRMASM